MTAPVSAKRLAPEEVTPIVSHGRTYEQEFRKADTQFTILIVAKDKRNGKLLWETEIYKGLYNKSLETDVQEIFLKSMTIENHKIIAKDERGQIYKIDAKTGKRLEPKTPPIYPPSK